MIYPFTYTTEDYLEALALEKANRRQSMGIVHLFFMAAAGCAVYLNLSTLRGTLRTDDAVSYGAAFLTVFLLAAAYSPRLMPSLAFRWRLRTGQIPEGVIGRHTLAVEEDYLEFSCGDMRHRTAYSGLIRVNHNDRIALFYLANGAVEAVPLVAFGSSGAGRARELKRIEELARRASAGGARADGFVRPGAVRVDYRVSREDFLRCNVFHERRMRARALRDPAKCFWLVFLILAAVGSVRGLVAWCSGETVPMGFVHGFYVLEALGCALGASLWYRPAALVNCAVRQSLKAGRYPPGYWGERAVWWDRGGIAFRYGAFSSSLPWKALSDICEDSEFLYFYQQEQLIMFIPTRALGNRAAAMREIARQNGGAWSRAQ